ncbi:uncharacterized protein LOC130632739 [Hydractinia symbiolongicarpus]|uniref:uncharacterized protein LOC130632739 n=1 Tax=Hydractinia symbiolongicarpus TaxID=13093 RepID=UPI00254BA0D3|nr:uncharacterized protein LOC130632739 [Hydractinia symbiolongicarpus]
MSKNYDSDIDWIYDTASSDDETDLLQNKNKRRGRPSIHEKYPEIITCVKTLIEQGSAEAYLRRRDSVMYTNGLSLNDIVMHVKKTLGITVSRHTIHRLMLPPRKKNTASKNYKCLIDARVPPKRNTKEKKTHDDFHFTCGQVRIVNEMGYLCKEIKQQLQALYTEEELAVGRIQGGVRNYQTGALNTSSLSPNRMSVIVRQAKKRYSDEFMEMKNLNEIVNSKCRQVKRKLIAKQKARDNV